MYLITYLIFRTVTFPLSFLPYLWLHKLGNILGIALFYLYPNYRKRALSNLAIATSLNLSAPQIRKMAKASLKNLLITFLEYPKLAREKEISKIASCTNPETAKKMIEEGQGVIFFCGHQANWELFFLEGTSRMPGVAIGRPIKNRFLYNWVLKLRQKYGGKIVEPKNALKEGLKTLKRGAFFGIVGDQGMPNSGFSSLFLGKKAWTSPLAALLSLRTNAPIFVATNKREHGKYLITYSDPIYPQEGENVDSLMQKVLLLFEKSIQVNPEQWLWIHNRWKQQLPGKLPKNLRYDSLALIFPSEFPIQEAIQRFEKMYPSEFVSLFLPIGTTPLSIPSNFESTYYQNIQDLLIPDFRFKLVYDFTLTKKLKSHFLRLSAFHVLQPKSLRELDAL